MPRGEKHWIIKRLEYLRRQAKHINFSSGATRRRRDLIEVFTAINDSRYDFGWRHCFHLSISDAGATGKIILSPTHWSDEGAGKIILEYPSFHHLHRMIFIFVENPVSVEIAKALRQELHKKTFALEFCLILKQGRKLTPIGP